jgi:hypothetical protein
VKGLRNSTVNLPSRRAYGTLERRDFLMGTAVVAGGLAAAPLADGSPAHLLPTVALGPYKVTRLISGGNPLYGYSHFNAEYSREMLDYFTDARVAQYLLACEKAGINTWESNYQPIRFARQYPIIREAGCRIQWICLAASWDAGVKSRTPNSILEGMLKCAEIVSKFKPIGVVHHGNATDTLWRADKIDLIKTFVNKVHDLGFPAGISTHNPEILQVLEEKGWPTDFYMTCLYYATRQPEEFKKEIGVLPVGETFLSTDPPKMCEVIRRVRKPCLAYKLLAAGRRCGSSAEVQEAFQFAFENIKPTDAAIVGMYPRYSDQINEDVQLVREILLDTGSQH